MQENTLITKPLLKSLGVNADICSRNHIFLQLFTVHASEAQIAALTKAAKFGWKATRIVYRRDGTEGCALALCAGETTAWMLPNGTIERAANGKRTAYLSNDWIEHV